jgi:hypothetical protein
MQTVDRRIRARECHRVRIQDRQPDLHRPTSLQTRGCLFTQMVVRLGRVCQWTSVVPAEKRAEFDDNEYQEK